MERGIYNIINSIYISGDIHGDYRVFEHILVDLAHVCHVERNSSYMNTLESSKLEYNSEVEDDIDISSDEGSEYETDVSEEGEDEHLDIYGFRKGEQLHWNEGNSTYVIFVGDIIDSRRERHGDFSTPNDEIDDIYILGTIIRLQQEAIKYGGNILLCLGNHEYLNFMHFNGIIDNKDFIDTYSSDENKEDNREDYFIFGSDFMKKLSQIIYIFLKINNIMIVHAGFHNDYITERDIYIDNEKFRRIIRGMLITDEDKTFLKKFNDDNSPIMYQDLGLLRTQLTNNKKCDDIVNIFKKFDIMSTGFLIIGHIAQSLENTLGINSTCNNMIWRVDVGMSKCYDNNLEKVTDYLVENDDSVEHKIHYVDRLLYSNYEKCRAIAILSFKYNEYKLLYDTPIIITQNKMSGQLYSSKEFMPEFKQSISHMNGLEHLIGNLEKQEFDGKIEIINAIRNAKTKLVGGNMDIYKYKYMKYKTKYFQIKHL